MKRLLLASLLLIAAVMLCTPLDAQDKAAQGQKIFQRERCSMCHTAQKNSLADVGTRLTADQIREWIQTPKLAAQKSKSTAAPAMRSYEKLSKEDVDALVVYLQTMKEAAKSSLVGGRWSIVDGLGRGSLVAVDCRWSGSPVVRRAATGEANDR